MKTSNVWNFHLSVGELFTSRKILMWLPRMGITWSFSCNIQQGLWKFLESRLGNVNVMYQQYQPKQKSETTSDYMTSELEGLRSRWSIKQLAPPTKKTQKRHHDIKELVSPAHMYNTNLERLYSTLVQDFIICLISNDNIQPAMRTWSHWALWPQGFNLRHAPARCSPRPRRTKNGEKPSRWCRQNS